VITSSNTSIHFSRVEQDSLTPGVVSGYNSFLTSGTTFGSDVKISTTLTATTFGFFSPRISSISSTVFLMVSLSSISCTIMYKIYFSGSDSAFLIISSRAVSKLPFSVGSSALRTGSYTLSP